MVSIELFKNSSTSTLYHAGQPIFRVGDTADYMYVVLEGRVRIFSSYGRELEVLGPGGVFGEVALIDHGPRSASATAVTDCRVVRIGQDWFEYLVQETPHFALQIMRVMADRLRRSISMPSVPKATMHDERAT